MKGNNEQFAIFTWLRLLKTNEKSHTSVLRLLYVSFSEQKVVETRLSDFISANSEHNMGMIAFLQFRHVIRFVTRFLVRQFLATSTSQVLLC